MAKDWIAKFSVPSNHVEPCGRLGADSAWRARCGFALQAGGFGLKGVPRSGRFHIVAVNALHLGSHLDYTEVGTATFVSDRAV